MLKKIKTKTIIIGSVVLLAAILLIGFTYAYFTAIVTGNDTAKTTQVYAGTMALRLNGSTQITCNNLYPGGTCTYNFSVENTGTLTTSYELDFVDVLNDLEVKNELVYSLTKDSQVQITENEAPSVGEMILPAVVIEPDAIQEYTLTLTFKETGEDQSYNQNKHFSARVNIRGIDSSNYLQAKVLARHIYTTTPDFTTADPVKLSTEKKESNKTVSITSNITGNRVLGTGYTFNEKNGIYTLTGTSENQIYNNSSIGKYTCNSGKGKCVIMYKIKEVDTSSASENYTESITSNQTKSYSSNSNRTIATSYYLDQTNGYFTLSGTVEENQTYSSTSVGKYTCNNANTTCATLSKINNVTDTTVDNVDTYIRTANTNKVTKADYYTKQATDRIYSQSGLYQTPDDQGTSYYFRGKVDNNYVSFANQLWRIMRINGDGSIRLILAGNTGTTSKFNAVQDNKKYVGYTYDNESACTKASPCISNYDATTQAFINNKTVTNNTIKDYIENTWYKDNLATYNDKIVMGNYCNDTSIYKVSGNSTYYGAYGRVREQGSASLICPDTTENYGGFYQSKVGLASADEVAMAGLIYSTGDPRDIGATYRAYAEKTNYIYHASNWWVASPYYYTGSAAAHEFNGSTNSRLNCSNVGSAHKVRPVINLKADTTISTGDGSQNNPYVVE